jgi:hypothetical protein
MIAQIDIIPAIAPTRLANQRLNLLLKTCVKAAIAQAQSTL